MADDEASGWGWPPPPGAWPAQELRHADAEPAGHGPYVSSGPAPWGDRARPASARTDGVAVAALVTGVVGLGVVALILGVVGLRRTRRDGTGGRGFAITGIVLGAVGMVAGIALAIGGVVAFQAYRSHIDDLHTGCADGDMTACDALFDRSWPGSAEERFGDTCGGRTSGGGLCQATSAWAGSDAFAYGDDAELDVLWDACAAGDDAACDDLYFTAPPGSQYEQFADTCGGRTDGGTLCTDER